jgi:6-phosphogluconolactonase
MRYVTPLLVVGLACGAGAPSVDGGQIPVASAASSGGSGGAVVPPTGQGGGPGGQGGFGGTTAGQGGMAGVPGVSPFDRTLVITGSDDGLLRVFRFSTYDGGLLALGATTGGTATSFLAPDVQRGRLYAVNQNTSQVAAYRLDSSDGGLILLNKVSSGGANPNFVSVDRSGRFVFVSNYNGGNAAVLAVTDAGLSAPIQVVPSGGQAHQMVIDADNRYVYVPCKKANHVAQYLFDGGTLVPLLPSVMSTEADAGPRHLAFHPSLPRAYLLNELDDTLQTLSIAFNGTLASIQVTPTLPLGVDGGANSTAEVVVHPNGKFVYASNRGHNSIARFAIGPTTGLVTVLGHTPSGGDGPRHFSLDVTGRWLVVANRSSNGISLFRLDPGTGDLQFVATLSVPSPAYAGFVALP